ncbi:hypothetical protein ABK040_009826 [Willaertia magna]
MLTTKPNNICNNNISTDNDDPSPNDYTQWLPTGIAFKPNFEFYYPNTWQLEPATLRLQSPIELSPWKENDGDSLTDHIKVDLSLNTNVEQVHDEICKKLANSQQDFQIFEKLANYSELFHQDTNYQVKRTKLQYQQYGHIRLTKHFLVTITLKECTYMFSYLTETENDRNISVFQKFIRKFIYPNEHFYFQLKDLLFCIPFPYQVITPQKKKKHDTLVTLHVISPKQLRSQTELVKTNDLLFFEFELDTKWNGDETNLEKEIKEMFETLKSSTQNLCLLPNALSTSSTIAQITKDFTKENFTNELIGYGFGYLTNDNIKKEKYYLPIKGHKLTITFTSNFQQEDEEYQTFKNIIKSLQFMNEIKDLNNKYIINSSLHGLTLNMENQTSEFNIAVLGSTNVGKTTILQMFIHQLELSTVLNDLIQPTKKEISYRKYIPKSDSHSSFILNLLDICGNEKYESTSAFDKIARADAILLFCSSDEKDSLKKLETYKYRIEKMKKRKISELPSLLIYHIKDNDDVKVTQEEVKSLADEFGVTFIELNSKKLIKVNEIFEESLYIELYQKQYLLNSLQQIDLKTLNEEVENFQYLILQNNIDAIHQLMTFDNIPCLAAEYMNVPILFYAIDNLREEGKSILKLLIEHNKKKDKFNLKNFLTNDYHCLNLALYAANRGNLNAIKILEEEGITIIDQLNNRQCHLLAYVLKSLLNNNNDLDDTQLLQMISANETVNYLLEKYSDILKDFINLPFKEEDNTIIYPIHIAVKGNSIYALKWLLMNNNNNMKQTLNEKDSYGNTALLYAMNEGKIDLLEILLENGADISLLLESSKQQQGVSSMNEFLQLNCPIEKSAEIVGVLDKFGIKV